MNYNGELYYISLGWIINLNVALSLTVRSRDIVVGVSVDAVEDGVCAVALFQEIVELEEEDEVSFCIVQKR